MHEKIRLMDAENVEKGYIKGRFKEYARFADCKARCFFKNPTISMIKCSYGFNKYGKRS